MSTDWLTQLAPDRAPPPPLWWPPAPGWWALLLLLVLGCVIGAALYRGRRRPSVAAGKRGWRRAALRELAQLEAAGGDDASVARSVQQVARRFAVARYGRACVAALSGDAWVAFVVAHGGPDWAGQAGRDLLRCAYGGGAVAGSERERWLAGARGFVKASS